MRSSRTAWRAAWPSRTWWRCRATPQASSPAASFRSRCRAASNAITIEYKRYGVGLAFTPTVLRDGLINLKIEPEVSQLDLNHPVALGPGLPPIPPLIVRRASTTIELRDGQSFVIGGLLQNVSKAQPAAAALARRRAGARRAVREPLLSEERDRSRHHRHAAPRAAGAAWRRRSRRRSTTRCRRTTSTSS